MQNTPLSLKMHRVLRVIFFLLLIIAFRVWHLSFVERDQKLIDSKRPQKRTIQIHANRGLILDRYGEPLACNRLRYHAAIYYSHIRQLPQSKWEIIPGKGKIKTYPRREHITALSRMLGAELHLDPLRIEDLIHSKASLLPHVPFIIKENISEKEFCHLRLLEKDWVGLHAQMGSERFYPHGEVASHVLGYMGAISPKEYLKVAEELKNLQEVVDQEDNLLDPSIPYPFRTINEVQNRLQELKKYSYCINDLVGKSGLESVYDQQLRGYHGKETYSIDINGNFLKKLPESERASGGQTIKSTISWELQKFAEELLIEDEVIRSGKSRYFDSKTKKTVEQPQPWIKGGAIVAMDPNTGEILALATHPRFNPNDFIPSSNPQVSRPKQNRIIQWFETPSYIGQIWNGFTPLSRERKHGHTGDTYYEEEYLTFEKYLSLLFPQNSSLFSTMEKIQTLSNAIKIQESVEELLFISGQKNGFLLFDALFPKENSNILADPQAGIEKKEKISLLLSQQATAVAPLKKTLFSYLGNISDNRDKLLLVDLCRVLVNSAYFSDELIEQTKNISLADYWQISRKVLLLEKQLQEKARPIFHERLFAKWREENQKAFLQEKRDSEKKRKTYQRPYLDYLDKEEKTQFARFWQENRLVLLTYLFSFSPQKDLPPPLKPFEETFSEDMFQLFQEKDLSFLGKFEDATLYDFLKTLRPFDQLDRQLYGRYPFLRHTYSLYTEKDLASAFYPKNGFHFGRSYAFQLSTPLGSLFKIVTGYSALKQQYEEREKNHQSTSNLNPLTLLDTIRWDRKAKKNGAIVLAYSPEGIPYPKYYKGGRLIASSHPNLGQISLPEALERSSNPYFSILAGDYLKDPEDLARAAFEMGFGKKTGLSLPGEIHGNLAYDLSENKTGLYSFAIGHHTLVATPIQAALMLSAVANGGEVLKPQTVLNENFSKEVDHQIFLPDPIRQKLIEGLHLVVSGKKGNARFQVIKKLHDNPALRDVYQKISSRMIGKTSTAEFMHQPYIFSSSKAEKFNDIWFGAIYFEDNPQDPWAKPELVVVVYLHFGDGGKEAAPLAAQVINKFLAIKEEKAKIPENAPAIP